MSLPIKPETSGSLCGLQGRPFGCGRSHHRGSLMRAKNLGGVW